MRMRARLLPAALALALVLLALLGAEPVQAQDGFQLPVQLVGFPVITMAVRISNFMKKLAYAVSPRTYASRRVRRAAPSGSPRALHEALSAWDGVERAPPAAVVEKLLLHEFGSRVCVFERVCAQHAQRALHAHARNDAQLDWDALFSHYKTAPAGEKQNYLLSVFLGGMVRSPALCLDLAKRGRSCSAHQHTSSTNATTHAAGAPKRTHHARAPPRPAARSRGAPRPAHDLPRAADRPAQVPRLRQTKQTSSGL